MDLRAVGRGRPGLFYVVRNWLKKHRLLWQRTLIILGVLSLSAILTFAQPADQLIAVLALPFLIAGVIILLRWPPLGFILLIVANLVINVSIPVVGLAASLIVGLTALWVVDMVVIKRKILFINSRPIWSLLVYLVITFLAFGVGQLPWYPVPPAPLGGQIGGIVIVVLLIGIFLLAAHQIRDMRWLQWMTFVFLGLGGVYVLGRSVPGLIQIAQRIVPGTAIGSLFWLWLMGMSLSQALFNRRLKVQWRLLLAGITLTTIYVAMFQARAWTSGWLPGLVTLIVVLWIGAPKGAFFVTLAAAGVMAAQFQDLLATFINVGDNEYSMLTRVEAWRIVIEIVKVNPILGIGPANYRAYTTLFPILGWFVEFNSHNNYVDIIAQTGLLGLACILWFAWEIGRLGWRLRSQVPKGGFLYAYVIGALAGLVGMLVAGMLGDWVLPFYYNVGINGLRSSALGWLFLGSLVAIERKLAAQNEDEPFQEEASLPGE